MVSDTGYSSGIEEGEPQIIGGEMSLSAGELGVGTITGVH